jgi:hypothetical protein
LEHPLFTQVRNLEKEKIVAKPVALDFEKDDLNRDKLRQLILHECSYFKK